MYRERKFDTWQDGIIHFVITIMMPLLPIVIYLLNEDNTNNYLYVLLLTVIISFAYEFTNYKERCSTMLIIENILTCIALAILFIWDVFMLTYVGSQGVTIDSIGLKEYIMVSFFSVPIIVTIVEIIRTIKYDIDCSKNPPNENKNLVNGAAKV